MTAGGARSVGAASGGGARRFVVTAAEAGVRLDAVLARRVPEISRTLFARHIAAGAVSVNGRRGAPSQRVRAGDAVAWTPPAPRPTDTRPEARALDVVYEDADLLVLDKPAGLVVHPAAGHESGTLVNALLHHCRDLRGVGGALRPGIVHRLDKDTTGLLVVAKDDATLNALAAAFAAHEVHRVYEALVVGVPGRDAGRIDTLHGRDPRHRKKFTTRVKAGRRAITNWRVLERLPGAARIECRLETGRTHQVRVHMAALGHPIVGDPTYARPPRDPGVRAVARALGRQALHARELGFRHPRTGAELRFVREPPADFAAALAALREAARPLPTASPRTSAPTGRADGARSR